MRDPLGSRVAFCNADEKPPRVGSPTDLSPLPPPHHCLCYGRPNDTFLSAGLSRFGAVTQHQDCSGREEVPVLPGVNSCDTQLLFPEVGAGLAGISGFGHQPTLGFYEVGRGAVGRPEGRRPRGLWAEYTVPVNSARK